MLDLWAFSGGVWPSNGVLQYTWHLPEGLWSIWESCRGTGGDGQALEDVLQAKEMKEVSEDVQYFINAGYRTWPEAEQQTHAMGFWSHIANTT